MDSALLTSAKAEIDTLREYYRHLHKFPEAGMVLPETVAFIKKKLERTGIYYEDCGGGIIAFIGKGERCVLLRADMDALEMREETGLEFASEGGNMHACGHDMHTAMLLGAARLLKDRENEIGGRVALCFQPGEETLTGAKSMLDRGLIERTGAEAAVMIHVMTATPFLCGTAIIPPKGVGAAGADFFRIDLIGKSCHGSTPHLGRDPVAALALIIQSLSSLTAREVKGGEGDVLTLGMIKGGEAPNVIPERISLWGTLRSYSDESRDFIKERLSHICAHTAKALRCRASVEFTSSAPSFVNDPHVRERAIRALRDARIPIYQVPMGEKGGGSEDFAYVSRRIPSLMLCISAGNISEGYTEPLHSPRARFDEGALPYGAAAFAAVAAELLR